MRFSKDNFGGMQVIREVMVYDTAAIALGELLMLGTTTPDSNADHGVAFVTAYTGANTEAIDAIGIALEAATPTTLPGAEVAGNYIEVISNPGALYFAEYSQAADDDIALTQVWTGTTLTIASLEDNIDCGWIYASDQSATSNFEGQLRYISASASGSCTVVAPNTNGGTSDTVIKILPPNHRTTELNAGATGLLSDANVAAGLALHIVDNYITQKKVLGVVPLRRYTHDGLNSLTDAKIFAEIAMLDHVYNNA
jgi:hypothetical protein